ncbi:hypothetical protein R5P86_08370 [Oenococcus oeni]|uniref:rolling circle replication-associated protein n=1 Tax=Oenococcus oeni TaxID=1247 RepID=UPI00050DE318|nr:hypothetical protein [Oenococcus oeni]KGH87577.1 hypothetical protein X350_08290 [Oenococcus oeni S12]
MKDNKKALNPKVNVKAIRWGSNLTINNNARADENIIRNLPNGQYVNTMTGEIKDRKFKAESRLSNKKVLKQTFKRIRYLIAENFENPEDSVLFITLTYRVELTDPKRLMIDFHAFIKRLRYWFSLNHHQKIAYFFVVEIQPFRSNQASKKAGFKRPIYHGHLLIKSIDGSPLYIRKNDLEKIWGLGIVWISRVKKSYTNDSGNQNVSHISAYLSSYLTDAKGNDHKRIKMGKLSWYQPGVHLYRYSRNLKGLKDLLIIKDHSKKEVLDYFSLNDRSPDYISLPRECCFVDSKGKLQKSCFITEIYNNLGANYDKTSKRKNKKVPLNSTDQSKQ